MTLGDFFTTLANEIRGETGKSDLIRAQDLPSAIRGLNSPVKLKSATGEGGTSVYDSRTHNSVSLSFSISSFYGWNGGIILELYCTFSDSAGGGTDNLVQVDIS